MKIEIEQEDYNKLLDKLQTLTNQNEQLLGDIEEVKQKANEKEDIINTLNNDKFELVNRLTKYTLGNEPEEKNIIEDNKEDYKSLSELADLIGGN